MNKPVRKPINRTRTKLRGRKAELKALNNNCFKVGGVKGMEMTKVVFPNDFIDDEPKLTCLSDIKRMIQDSMKMNGITAKEARKAFGIKRYEE